MTSFNQFPKALSFKLGVTIPERDMSKYNQPAIPNKPIIVPKIPEPNIFFSQIEDNRELILEQIKRDMDYQLELRRNTLPNRY